VRLHALQQVKSSTADGGVPDRHRMPCRQKHGYAQSDILSTEGIVDQVERVHCSVRLFGWPDAR
jgi:hypothetical protein